MGIFLSLLAVVVLVLVALLGAQVSGLRWLFGVAPMIRKVCKDNDMKLTEIYELFPSGPAKGACKVAGLPKPTGCV